MILSNKNGFDSHVYPIPWISSKKFFKGFTYVLVPVILVVTAGMYFFGPFPSALAMLVADVIVVVLLFRYLAFGKERLYTIVSVSTEDRGTEEYKRVYWKLIGILKRILEEKGFRYEKVAEWPKIAYRVIDKGFEVSVNPAHSLGEVYCYGLEIGPVTSDNYIYVGVLQKSLSQSFVEEGLVRPRGRVYKRF